MMVGIKMMANRNIWLRILAKMIRSIDIGNVRKRLKVPNSNSSENSLMQMAGVKNKKNQGLKSKNTLSSAKPKSNTLPWKNHV